MKETECPVCLQVKMADLRGIGSGDVDCSDCDAGCSGVSDADGDDSCDTGKKLHEMKEYPSPT